MMGLEEGVVGDHLLCHENTGAALRGDSHTYAQRPQANSQLN